MPSESSVKSEAMLIDYLENAAAEMKILGERLHTLDKEYRISYDRQVREEMARIKKEMRKKRSEIKEMIYLNLTEFRLIKKHFPLLLDVLLEDEWIGNALKTKVWLLDFKKLHKAECEKKLKKIKEHRGQLKEAREFIKGWVGKIDARSLTATWPALKGILVGESEKDDVLTAIDEADKKLRIEGWLLLFNEPFILGVLKRFIKRLKKATEEEYEKRTLMMKNEGKGSVAEYDAMKEFQKAKMKRARLERLCSHLLMVNQQFFENIKKGQMQTVWLDRESEDFVKKLFKNKNIPKIDENKWIREMKKRIEG